MRRPFANIGAVIKMLRVKAGMLQGELADRASVTKQQISKYERGIQRPNLDSLEKLMEALGINRIELVDALAESERSSTARASGGEADEEELRREAKQRAVLAIGRAVDELVKQAVEDIRREKQ